MAYDGTRDSMHRMQEDAQTGAQEVRGDVRSFVDAALGRAGIVGEDARKLGNDVGAYLQHWMQLVRDDAKHEAKVAAADLAMIVTAGFLVGVSVLLLNFGVIWSLSATDTGVGPWFLIVGGAWLVIGAALGLTGFFSARKAVRETAARVRSDTRLPQQHLRSINRTIQEQRHESSTTH